MPKLVSPRQWEVYNQRRKRGFSIRKAAEEAHIGYATARRYEGQLNAISPSQRPSSKPGMEHPAPIALEDLRPEAKRALEDFSYFQRRYLGRIATPWQAEAAYQVAEFLRTPQKEYVVDNAPPGAGKSTTFTHDIPAWLTVRNRAIRGLMGSKVESAAKRYVARLRRTLERTVPYLPEDEEIAKGLAVPAEATLADDFGAFKPADKDLWSAEGFVVAQHGNIAIAEKEPTWSAYGMDSGFLGMRYDFIVWDDLVDKLVMRTVEARENQQEWWDDVAEKRLEPGGLLLLQGQRMGADDLYRYCLDKRVIPDEDEAETPEGGWPKKYHHIVFKAHYEERCEGNHAKDSAPYPDGCLLDPRRLPWRELRAEMANPRNNFAVIYQQEDADPASVLVDPLWVDGGTDPKTGMVYPGCQDRDRDIWELPHGLFGDLVCYATADPSPTKYWSVQFWITRCVDGESQERYLIDHVRQAMDAPSFLDWNNPEQRFTGLMEEWQERSVEFGHPIKAWIVEKNGAQRFLLQYEHVRRWMAKWRVDIIPHETERNKADPQYGVQTIAGIYKFGLVRLPWKANSRGRLASMKLVEEVTHWPGWKTEDTVMAQWFGEFRLPHLVPSGGNLPRFERPGWLKNADTYSDAWRRLKVG